MLKQIKRAALSLLKMSGGFSLIQHSSWRRGRLLILAYHGVALADEHLWNPNLYMAPNYFRARLQLIKAAGCTVLPLAEALRRLYAGDLPEKSVALTFDDGCYDFYRQTYPILSEFNFPTTLYLTTFYSHFNRPVFDVICPYLLWKGRGYELNLDELIGAGGTLSLAADNARDAAWHTLYEFARAHRLSAEEKDDLAARLAARLHVDYGRLLHERILHIMTPQEVSQLAAEGVDVQLHTHRHRTPMERRLFMREIEDNRHSIQAMTGLSPTHFCYPSGVYDDAFFAWLKESGVESATTCNPDIARRMTNPLLLPRLVDTSYLSSVEFEGWLTGVAALLPQRARG